MNTASELSEGGDVKILQTAQGGLLWVAPGSLAFQRDSDAAYYNSMLSYVDQPDENGVLCVPPQEMMGELDFLSREQVMEMAITLVQQLGIQQDCRVSKVFALTERQILEFHDKISGSDWFHIKPPVDPLKEGTIKGLYRVDVLFEIDGVPLFSSRSPISGSYVGGGGGTFMEAHVLVGEAGILAAEIMEATEMEPNPVSEVVLNLVDSLTVYQNHFEEIILIDEITVREIYPCYMQAKNEETGAIYLMPMWCYDLVEQHEDVQYSNLFALQIAE